ncbi:unnamed protein product (macronuclear) [Paramecium tetraurelia]|uniref:MORN repeat protein n=1 Tax=Paramecium tetraurelia TaxID=5888 RepID=A0BVY3_PARTE|nr:uncharacterized protein GSPATT00032552001 [Paramecium tetraurelia]CAK62700.1 unnamed protein product [Paramecium tetraurelia]|eukprot:XP_001430098.1 hypothetical protein (macronuclear) [Paramecium tetraurelia strain d4-2]
MYSFDGEVIMRLENVDLQKMKRISKIAEEQNQMAMQYGGFILEIEKILYDPYKYIMCIKYKDHICLKKLEYNQFMDEQTKYLLINQACVLLKILSQISSQQQISQKSSEQEISQHLGQLLFNSQNFFLNGANEILAITFISDNLWTNSEQTHTYRKAIARLMEIIIEHPQGNLGEDIQAFFNEQIQELKQDNFNIYYFFSNYCEMYDELQQNSQQTMPTLPKELLNEAWFNQASAILTEQPLQFIFKNKMIDQKKYQQQARLCCSQENFDPNYFYYFDQRRLVLYREQNRNKNSIDRVNKLDKVLNLYNLISDLIEGFQLDKIPTLEKYDPTEQYFVLYHVENHFSQNGNKDQVRDFRIYFSQIIHRLNKIDPKEFEFNQIKKEIDTGYINKERNKMLFWLELENNKIIDQFIQYQTLKQQGQMMALKDLNKVIGVDQFKISYFIKAQDHSGGVQIGYAIDDLGNYYKGIFQNGQLYFGDILQVSQNQQQITWYENVSYQNKIIFGDNCKKTVYNLKSRGYQELEFFRGNLRNGQYHEQGYLKQQSKNQKYEGKWVNGLFEGQGTLTILNCDNNKLGYTKYVGNFHKGEFHDQQGIFYLDDKFTQSEKRNFQNGQQIGKAIRQGKRSISFQQIFN